MNDHLSSLRLFVRVARRGSFSAGGRELNIPQPTVSRTIAMLEREMGAALFTRTTRAVTLTEAGADFLARIEPILGALDEAEYAVRGTGELRGVLRVGISSTFAIREIAPRLPSFMEKHPALRVELLADDLRQNFVNEGIDVGLRFGSLPDSTAVARRIATWSRVIVASPAYLERSGVPQKPADLAAHSVIVGPSRLGPAWTFRKNGKATSVRVGGRLMATVNEVATAAAVAGLGLASMASVGCLSEIEKGSLVRVLPDWDMGMVELHAVFPSGRGAKPSARAFADFLVAESVHWAAAWDRASGIYRSPSQCAGKAHQTALGAKKIRRRPKIAGVHAGGPNLVICGPPIGRPISRDANAGLRHHRRNPTRDDPSPHKKAHDPA